MAPLSGSTAVFYVVLIAPGFIAVMTAISLAAVEDDHSKFVLLVWSLVTSLVIDTVFLFLYQTFVKTINSFDELPTILFTPHFRVDIIAGILLASLVVGVFAAAGLLLDIPGRARRLLQSKFAISYNPRQPWENFMRKAGSIRIKTSDDELYTGKVVEWSRAEKPREVRIANPHRYHLEEGYEPVGGEDMLFLDDDIDRILLRSRDDESGRDTFQTIISGTIVWASKRSLTGGIVLFLIAWYGLQQLVAGWIGVATAERWFYFTPDIGTGWIVAPLSHDMENIGHLTGNLSNFLVAGSFAEPHLSRKEYLGVFSGLLAFSILAPVIASFVVLEGDWLVAGTSGGIYGLWAFMAVYRFDVLRDERPWAVFETWNDVRIMAERILVIVGFTLLPLVALNDIILTDSAENFVSHFAGISSGLFVGYRMREW